MRKDHGLKGLDEKEISKKVIAVLGEGCKVIGPVEKLGGMNNNSYKVTTNKGQFVLRLPGKGTEQTVDRKLEYKNSRLADALGLNCELIHFDTETGLKITRYIEDGQSLTVADTRCKENMKMMARTLRILHASKRKFDQSFDPFLNIKELEKDVVHREDLIFDRYHHVKSNIMRLRDELEKQPIHHVPCHIDAWHENFVKSGDRLYLIDWEYSGNYYKHWDLVSIALECGYSTEENEGLLHAYFQGNATDVDRKVMDILRIVMDFHWSLWALARVVGGERELYDYARRRFERGHRNMERYRMKHNPSW